MSITSVWYGWFPLCEEFLKHLQFLFVASLVNLTSCPLIFLELKWRKQKKTKACIEI